MMNPFESNVTGGGRRSPEKKKEEEEKNWKERNKKTSNSFQINCHYDFNLAMLHNRIFIVKSKHCNKLKVKSRQQGIDRNKKKEKKVERMK